MEDLGKCPCGKDAVWHREVTLPGVPPGYHASAVSPEAFRVPDYCDECFHRNVPEEEREGEVNGALYRWVKRLVG